MVGRLWSNINVQEIQNDRNTQGDRVISDKGKNTLINSTAIVLDIYSKELNLIYLN